MQINHEPAVRPGAANFLAKLMALYIIVAVGKIGDLVPGLHEIPLAKLVAGLAIIVAIRTRRTPGEGWRSIPPARLTVAVMGVTTVSILWSVLRSATLGVIAGSVLAVIVSLLLVIKAAREWTSVRTILHGSVVASLVLVATVLTSKVSDSGGDRAGFSGSYDPNDFAFVLLGLLPLVITFSILSRGAKRLIYAGIVGLVIFAILLTQSRGGFIGLVLEVVALTFLLPVVRRGRLEFRVSKSGVLARIVLLTLIGGIVWQSLPGSARARLATITSLGSDYNIVQGEGANAGRLAIWNRNLPLILQRPWGFGAGAFAVVDGRFAGGRYRAPHNTLLQALMELGIPGFILFVSTIVSSLRYVRVRGVDISRRDELTPAIPDEARAFARALICGWLGLCASGFFLSELYSNVLWTMVALSCAVGMIRRRQTATPTDGMARDRKLPINAGAIAAPTP
jgi:O-antigen ligase